MMLNICSSKPFELDMKATDDILFMELQAFKGRHRRVIEIEFDNNSFSRLIGVVLSNSFGFTSSSFLNTQHYFYGCKTK